MKHVPRQDQVGGQSGANIMPAEPDPDVLRLRSVHRAAADLRRGTPVLLTGEAPLILLAAETAGPRGLAELAVLAAEPPVLLLAPMRAAAVLHQPAERGSPVVALHVSAELLIDALNPEGNGEHKVSLAELKLRAKIFDATDAFYHELSELRYERKFVKG